MTITITLQNNEALFCHTGNKPKPIGNITLPPSLTLNARIIFEKCSVNDKGNGKTETHDWNLQN